MQEINGIPASPGVILGPAFIFKDPDISVLERFIDDVESEEARLKTALQQAKAEIEKLRDEAEEKVGVDEAAIFEAHALFLEDPNLLEDVNTAIFNRSVNCEFAWNISIEKYALQLEAMEDDYFRARAADLRDVGQRVLRLLMGIGESDLTDLNQPSIIVARDLTPSDTVRLDRSLVKGFCTAEGGPTSHTAILAKALGLPAVVGLGAELMKLDNGTSLLLDGGSGLVTFNPDEDTIDAAKVRMEKIAAKAELEKSNALDPAETKDGVEIEVVANIGRPEESRRALELGAEGVGLLRTEFLYLERDTAPDEDEQADAYGEILDVMQQRPVVIRTLDVGGDKPLPYLDLGKESNPFLGWRAIRVCLDQPDFFKVQLRALLRAGVGHDLRIMFPMIATLDEFHQAKRILGEARAELVAGNVEIADSIQVGIMVEVPSVVVLADQFAVQVDFFSIGTNDLTQYSMAAERTNEKVAHLGDALHPAILRQVQQVITAGHEHGIWVGLCGELAGDPLAVPILLGMGLDEFSMAPTLIPSAKTQIRELTKSDTEQLAKEALMLPSAHAVRQLVRDFLN